MILPNYPNALRKNYAETLFLRICRFVTLGELANLPTMGTRFRCATDTTRVERLAAGSLEAFTQFLKALPPDSGMAYVLVKHLKNVCSSTWWLLLPTGSYLAKRSLRHSGLHDYEINPSVHSAAFGRSVVGDRTILSVSRCGDVPGVETVFIHKEQQHRHGARSGQFPI